MNTIVMDKKYKTKDGRAVRILCVDRMSDSHPVVAVVLDTEGKERLKYYTAEGKYWSDCQISDLDLVEVKKLVTYFKPLHKILAEHPEYWFDDDGVVRGVGMFIIYPVMFKYLDKPLSDYTGFSWHCPTWIEEREV